MYLNNMSSFLKFNLWCTSNVAYFINVSSGMRNAFEIVAEFPSTLQKIEIVIKKILSDF